MKRNQAHGGRCGDQGGFTLLELMLAIAVFSIGILAVASVQSTAVNTTRDARLLGDDMAQVNTILERFNAIPYDHPDFDDVDNAYQAPAGNPPALPNPDGTRNFGVYTVSWEVQDGYLVSPDSNLPVGKRITVVITRQDRSGMPKVRLFDIVRTVGT